MALYQLTFGDGGAVVRAKNGYVAMEVCREEMNLGRTEIECVRVHEHGDEEIVFAVEPSKGRKKPKFIDDKPDA